VNPTNFGSNDEVKARKGGWETVKEGWTIRVMVFER